MNTESRSIMFLPPTRPPPTLDTHEQTHSPAGERAIWCPRALLSVGRTATACASFGRFGPLLLPPSMLNPSSTGDGGAAAVHDGGDVACKH